MLAELKDLVQKGLFTQVRLALNTARKVLTCRVARDQTDYEEAYRLRNCPCQKGRQKERLPAVCSV